MNEKDKEDVIQFRQNVHTKQTFSKKEILKRPFSSLEGSIMKFLTLRLTGREKPQLLHVRFYRMLAIIDCEAAL
ncbi:MAG: hypothetical protein GY845_27545 [Planctomycetes bacterium]|nr:hypothetical protein [Planctomycetota bacterium]